MDTRLLRHYETELAYLREMGAEFAREYPKIASRLGMEGIEVLDPYVERLLEGAAFLSARVQLEIEQQVPEITSHLLEIVYPHYLCPVPSMMIAALEADPGAAGMADGYHLPRCWLAFRAMGWRCGLHAARHARPLPRRRVAAKAWAREAVALTYYAWRIFRGRT